MAVRSSRFSRMLSGIVVVVALAALSGCATTYKIRMRGVTPDPDKAVVTASRVFVEKVPELKEIEGDELIEKKLEHLLQANGWQVVDKAEADYILLYNLETTPIAARHSIGAGGTGKGGMKVTSRPGPFEKSVRLHMISAEPFRINETEQVLWSCHTLMPKVPNMSPRFADMLLVGAFQHFCEDTGAVITWSMSFNDKTATELHHLDPP